MDKDQIENLQIGDKIFHILARRKDVVKEVKISPSMVIVKTKAGRTLFYGGYNNDANVDLEFWDFDIPIPDFDFGDNRGKET